MAWTKEPYSYPDGREGVRYVETVEGQVQKVMTIATTCMDCPLQGEAHVHIAQAALEGIVGGTAQDVINSLDQLLT